MRPPTEHEKLTNLMYRKEFDTAEAEAADAKMGWYWDALMKASEELTEATKQHKTSKEESKDFRLQAFKCNLADAAKSYTKEFRKANSAWRKVSRADKQIEKMRTKGVMALVKTN